MTLEQKLVLAALIRAAPYAVIIASAAVYSARRRSLAGAFLALGCAGVAAKDIWSIFAPVWMRTHSVQEYGNINLGLSICSVAGLYLLAIAVAVILARKAKTPDNQGPEAEDAARRPAGPRH